MTRKFRQRQAPNRYALQNRLEGYALAIAIWFFRLIPIDAASYIMGKSWRLLAPFNARHNRTLTHLQNAMPDISERDRQSIARDMWENLGRVAAETFHIDRIAKQSERFEVVLDPATEAVLESGSACIMVSFHTGNWELCIWPVTQRGLQVTGVYQALRNPEADRIITSMRKDLYTGGLYSKNHETARKIVRTLKNGGIVGLLGDLRETRGIKVPFFDQMAYANPVPASLARSCGVPILIGRVVRKKGVNFRLEGRVLHIPATDDRQADIEAGTAQLHAVFENWIREYPGQWMWSHKKWATTEEILAQKKQGSQSNTT